MTLSTVSVFTTALGLQSPWQVKHVELYTAKHRIDFDIQCNSKRLSCPHFGYEAQGVYDRISKSWRHLDFFQYEAWLHADVPRVAFTDQALGELEPKARRSMTLAIRTHHEQWSQRHMQAMYVLERTHLKAARVWRMKIALNKVYEAAAQAQSEGLAKSGLKQFISWASRSRLEPFKRLANTLKTLWDGVVALMLQARTIAFVGGYDWVVAAGQASGSWVQKYRELHCHCLSEHVQTSPFSQRIRLRLQNHSARDSSCGASDVKFHSKRHRAHGW